MKKGKTGSIARREIGLKNRSYVQNGLMIYFVVNILFLLPMVFLNELKPDVAPAMYLAMLILYYLFRLTYIHLIGNLGMLVYNTYKLVKEKSLRRFIGTLGVVVLDVALNIYWILNGHIYTVQ